AGRFTLTFATAYSMSKRALIAFSDGLRAEVKPWDITVHTIQPSFYQTRENINDVMNSVIDVYHGFWDKAPEEAKKAIGLQYRDARVKSLRDLCYLFARPLDKMDEVTDDMIDAVAGVSPQV
ncbi:Short-chain dehydrogenase/reductase SDR, partial [Trinorchestia longiramus]